MPEHTSAITGWFWGTLSSRRLRARARVCVCVFVLFVCVCVCLCVCYSQIGHGELGVGGWLIATPWHSCGDQSFDEACGCTAANHEQI